MPTVTLRVTRGGAPAAGLDVIALYGATGGITGCFDGSTNASGEIVKTVLLGFKAVALVFIEEGGKPIYGGAATLLKAGETVLVNL